MTSVSRFKRGVSLREMGQEMMVKPIYGAAVLRISFFRG